MQPDTPRSMEDKLTLVNQLKIDRQDAPDRGARSYRLGWIVAGAIVCAAVAAYVLRGPQGTPVSSAEARMLAPKAHMSASTLDASGYIVARRQATVSSKIIGRVREVLIEEGQRVESGQVIARLDDASARVAVSQAQAELGEAIAAESAAAGALRDQQSLFAREREQHERGLISAQAFDTSKAAFNAAMATVEVSKRTADVARARLATANQNLTETEIRAPFSGIVTVKAAQAGEIVSPSSAGGGFTRTGIGTIVDMDSLELEVDVSENFINRVSAGQTASVTLNSYPEWQIPAEVIAVVPTADRAKATVKVRIGLKSKDSRIVPEMGARVSFLGNANDTANASMAQTPSLVIPADAVVYSEVNRQIGTVFVIEGNTLRQRSIRLGNKSGHDQVVLSGIKAGEAVATGDLSKLSDKMTVQLLN